VSLGRVRKGKEGLIDCKTKLKEEMMGHMQVAWGFQILCKKTRKINVE
jgi:hypothetical protein